MAQKKKLNILNLLDAQMGSDILALFTEHEHVIFSEDSFDGSSAIDILLIENESKFEQVKDKYQIDITKTHVYGLNKVSDVKHFIEQGGRFCTNFEKLSSAINTISLSQKVKNDLSIHLSDYTDKEVFNFSIVNHLMMGVAIDELSVRAIKEGFNLVSIRSFVDQLVYYLVYLKQAGFSGVPFECQYTVIDNQFVFRISAMVNNFSMENIIDSFEDNNKMGQIRYLLSAALNSCNFLDISLLENPNKIIFTAFFDENQSSKNWGFLINNIPYASLESSENDVSLYHDAESRLDYLSKLQDEFDGKLISGGFDYFNFSLDEDSFLYANEGSAQKVIDFMMDLFRESYPDSSISDFEKEHFDEFKGKYDDQNLISNLSENDENYIVEQVQKNHLVSGYERARKIIRDDQQIIDELQGTMSETLAQRVSNHVTEDIINDVLSLGVKEEKENIFGEFNPSIPDFDKASAFDELDFDNINKGPINLDLTELESESEKSQEKNLDLDTREASFEEEDFSNLHDSALPSHFDDASDDTIKVSGKDIVDQFTESIESFSSEGLLEKFESNFNLNLDDENFLVKGEKEVQDEIVKIVNSTLEQIDDEKLTQPVRSFVENELSDLIKEKLEESEEDLENLAHEKIREFSKENVPALMKDLFVDSAKLDHFKDKLKNLSSDDSVGITPFQQKFKDRLERSIESKVELEKVDGHSYLPKESLEESDRKNLVESTMKDVFDEEFSFDNASPQEIEKKENRLVDELSEILNMPKDDVRQIVKGASEKAKEQELEIISTFFEGEDHWKHGQDKDELISKINELEEENKQLKTDLSTLELQLSTNSSSKGLFDDIMEGKEVSQDEIDALAEEEFLKLNDALKTESELREALKDKISEIKKLQLEMGKQEIIYDKELEKYNKALHAKDVIIEKAKEALKTTMQKKDTQIVNLKKQVASLNDELDSGPKVQRRDDKEHVLAEEVKSLKKRIELEMDAHEDTQEKYQELREEIVSEQSKNVTLEKRLKTLESELNLLEDQNENLINTTDTTVVIKAERLEKENEQLLDQLEKMQEKLDDALAESMNSASDDDLTMLMDKNTKLNNKVKELMTKLKKAEKANVSRAGGGDATKEKHLKKNIDKLTQEAKKLRSEFAEKKKEATKYKTEATGLKNKMSGMQKEIDRLTKALSKTRNAA